MKTIPIPESFLILREYRALLNNQIQLWLREYGIYKFNLVEDISYHKLRDYYQYKPLVGLALEFENDQEALLFTLRWL